MKPHTFHSSLGLAALGLALVVPSTVYASTGDNVDNTNVTTSQDRSSTYGSTAATSSNGTYGMNETYGSGNSADVNNARPATATTRTHHSSHAAITTSGTTQSGTTASNPSDDR